MSTQQTYIVQTTQELMNSYSLEQKQKDTKSQQNARDRLKKQIGQIVEYVQKLDFTKEVDQNKVKEKFDQFSSKIDDIIEHHLPEDKSINKLNQKIQKVFEKNLERINKANLKFVNQIAKEAVKTVKTKPSSKTSSKKQVKPKVEFDYEADKKAYYDELKEDGYLTCSDEDCSCHDFTSYDELSSCDSSSEEEEKVKPKVKCTTIKCKPQTGKTLDIEEETPTPVVITTVDLFGPLFNKSIQKIESIGPAEAQKIIKSLKDVFNGLSQDLKNKYKSQMELLEFIL